MLSFILEIVADDPAIPPASCERARAHLSAAYFLTVAEQNSRLIPSGLKIGSHFGIVANFQKHGIPITITIEPRASDKIVPFPQDPRLLAAGLFYPGLRNVPVASGLIVPPIN